jgi:hypothetical protein
VFVPRSVAVAHHGERSRRYDFADGGRMRPQFCVVRMFCPEGLLLDGCKSAVRAKHRTAYYETPFRGWLCPFGRRCNAGKRNYFGAGELTYVLTGAVAIASRLLIAVF